MDLARGRSVGCLGLRRISQDCKRLPSPKNASRRGSLARGIPRGEFCEAVEKAVRDEFLYFF
jgi:hypothetical protein